MSTARHHSEWLSLIEVSGPFLSMPVLMRVFPQGLIAHDPEKFRSLKLAFEEWQANNEAGRHTNPAIHGAWVKFVLTSILGLPADSILEHQAIPQALAVTPPGEHAETVRPSLVLNDTATSKPRLLIQTYPPDQNLDKPVAGRTWKASPGTRMMELLHAAGVRLGLVTNGERWMLVDAPRNETTGFASWYATLWTEEPITLRAFISILSTDRFFGVSDKDTLEAMLAESASNQQEVTDQLGYQVRNAVEVLVQAIDRIDQDRNGDLLRGVDEKPLYEAALTYMMRLVFLFCAEERRLFPIDSELYAENYAASTLREQLRENAEEEVHERRHDAWSRLLATFRLIYGGCDHPELRMPAYAGHLFDPDRFPFLEGRKVGTKWTQCEAEPLPVNNRTVLHLLEALQLLQVKVPGSSERQARRLSFRALDIEQIGHVYEGLLDHTAKRATEPMLGLIGGRDREPEVPLSTLEGLLAKGKDKLVEFLCEETGRSESALTKAMGKESDMHDAGRLRVACGNDEKLFARIQPFAAIVRRDTYDYPTVIRAGSVFVTGGTDRRSSGTHYTPKSLTEPIVQYTLEPLVYIGPAEGKPQDQWQLRTPRELLDLKICDMACGSGAFLVQGCRYLSERLVEAWERAEKDHPGTPGITPEGTVSTGKPGESLIPRDADERMIYARRIVAQRCLYGVDINPLAAEMAKLSLWLLTLAKDKPFEFLDHAIRCGDSLVGIHNTEQLRKFNLDGKGEDNRLFLQFMDEKIKEAIALRRRITGMQANTAENIECQDRMLREANEKIDRLKCAADMLISAEFVPGSGADKRAARDDAAIKVAVHFHDGDLPTFSREARKSLAGQVTFHWPLEFPEVMVERGGFDALVGNPPFMGGSKITGSFSTRYRDFVVSRLAESAKGNADLCTYFLLRFRHVVSSMGYAGMITTNKIAQGDSREVGLQQLLQKGTTIFRAVPSRRWSSGAIVFYSAVWLSRQNWKGYCILDDESAEGITSYLTAQGIVDKSPLPLAANKGHSFTGNKVYGEGFVLSSDHAQNLLADCTDNNSVISPYLVGEDFNSRPDQSPSRWVINFGSMSEPEARRFKSCFAIVQSLVKPYRDTVKRQHTRDNWWLHEHDRPELYAAIADLDRVLAVSLITNHLGFAFAPSGIVFGHKLAVFPTSSIEDWAIIQSSLHYCWAWNYSSTNLSLLNYSPSDCFLTFPFPNAWTFGRESRPDLSRISGDCYENRQAVMLSRQEGLTKTYNRFHHSDETRADIQTLRQLHVEMDNAVAAAYGWTDLDLGHGFHETKQGVRYTISEPARREVLARLLKLNHQRYAEEAAQGLHDKNRSSGSKGKSRAKAPIADGRSAGLFGVG